VRALEEQDHYEVLEVSRDVVLEDVEHAYRVACETYSSESLATYSVFGDAESEAIRKRIDKAYRVLSDVRAREDYDAMLEPLDEHAEGPRPGGNEAASIEAAGLAPGPAAAGGEPDTLDGASGAFMELEADVEEEEGDPDGAMLRRARMRRGFELDQIADVTKISIGNLRNIEDENWDDLPATVYVRGFLTAYAHTIGLDPQRVVASYVQRLESMRVQTVHGRSRSKS
jgi:flagellar biosynthesis protein FlhG